MSTSYLKLSVAATDHGAAIPNLKLHLAWSQASELELVVSFDKSLLAELLGADVDYSNEVRFALGYKNNTADGILGSCLDILGLANRV
jgi:hypothetical protein